MPYQPCWSADSRYDTQFDKLSFEHRGQKGSGLIAQRKRDIKRIKEATALALKLTQFAIPDLGDFPGGQPA
ncbi:TPA: hypothetical protein MIH07_13060 [Klebsiella pneumoniae]|nr:hypothetical protein [Klebsiella pneumoniae]